MSVLKFSMKPIAILPLCFIQDTNPSDLWELNPETVSKRLVKQGVEGPITVSKDGKIALLEDINRLIVVDSTGEVLWQKEIGLHKMILSSFIQKKHLKGETPCTFFTSMS